VPHIVDFCAAHSVNVCLTLWTFVPHMRPNQLIRRLKRARSKLLIMNSYNGVIYGDIYIYVKSYNVLLVNKLYLTVQKTKLYSTNSKVDLDYYIRWSATTFVI